MARKARQHNGAAKARNQRRVQLPAKHVDYEVGGDLDEWVKEQDKLNSPSSAEVIEDVYVVLMDKAEA